MNDIVFCPFCAEQTKIEFEHQPDNGTDPESYRVVCLSCQAFGPIANSKLFAKTMWCRRLLMVMPDVSMADDEWIHDCLKYALDRMQHNRDRELDNPTKAREMSIAITHVETARLFWAELLK